MNQTISALKVGCGKFFHGPEMIRLLPNEIMRLGGRALIIGGPTTLDLVLSAIGDELDSCPLTYKALKHTDYCTTAWAHQYADMALDNGYTVLVGVGGGKVIDEVKCASVFSGLPVITVPTSIATCVATSMVAIMYNEKGQRAPAVNLKKEVDVCIADTDLIGTAPKASLAAGILDSIAKLPESYHQKKIEGYQDCTLREYIQLINSKAIFEFLMSEGRTLYRQGKDATRFQDCVLTNLLHTSIVSGFADGSGQLAIAHATYDFMRTYNTEASYHYYHGAMVAVGVLIQMAYNRNSAEEIEAVRSLMRDLEMPLTLSDLEYDTSPESLEFFTKTIAANANITTPEDYEFLKTCVCQAL
ncbi:MAG: iron-containing alcohol dehydrogenase [Candidatus Onthomonas sp.]